MRHREDRVEPDDLAEESEQISGNVRFVTKPAAKSLVDSCPMRRVVGQPPLSGRLSWTMVLSLLIVLHLTFFHSGHSTDSPSASPPPSTPHLTLSALGQCRATVSAIVQRQPCPIPNVSLQSGVASFGSPTCLTPIALSFHTVPRAVVSHPVRLNGPERQALLQRFLL